MLPRRTKRAFTLIELLVAFFILFVVTYLIYSMLISGSKTAVAGIWRKTTNERLQQAGERIRKALEGASYPSILTPEMNVLDRDEKHWVILKKGSPVEGADTEVSAANKGEGQYFALGPGRKDGSDAGPEEDQVLVLVATNCAPGRDRMEGLVPPKKDGEYQRFYFWLEGRREVLRGGLFSAVMDLKFKAVSGTYAIPGSLEEDTAIAVDGAGDTGIPDGGTTLVSDVNSIKIRLTDGDGEEAEKVPDTNSPEPPTIEISIRCVETHGGKATLPKVIKVQPHTGVRFE